MKLSRRGFVKASAASAAFTRSAARAMATQPPALVIYDSRIVQSRSFAQSHGAPMIDIALQHDTRWRDIRAGLPQGRIVGLTRWSDFVSMRGIAVAQGLRVAAERPFGALHLWELG